MPLSREDILAAGGVRAELPQREVPFAPLKGDVIVRGLWLEERLAHQDEIAKAHARIRADVPEGQELSAQQQGVISAVTAVSLLTVAVVGADGKPLLTDAEWRALAGAHPVEVMALCSTALDLAGMGAGSTEAAAKN